MSNTFVLRDDLMVKAESLYNQDCQWSKEAGCMCHDDLNAYINFVLFKALDEEQDFFMRRALIKKYIEPASELGIDDSKIVDSELRDDR